MSRWQSAQVARMRRKTLIRIAMVLAALGGLLTALYLMLQHEPAFYRQKEIQPGALRKKQAGECENYIWNLLSAIDHKDEGRDDHDAWGATFTEAQLNSYFQERFEQSGFHAVMPVKGVHSFRVAIDDDVVRLGFRLGEPPWSSVVSVDFKIWQVPNETNVIALQLLGVRAGMIPLSSKLLMDKLTALARAANSDTEVSWYRHDGYLVALLRFGATHPRQGNNLDELRVSQGRILLSGHSLNGLREVPK
jgi:hypothetical protein